MPKASVKIMRSYDYCHFEICLGTDEEKTLQQIDDLRKDAARLVDKAVAQYMKAKHIAQLRPSSAKDKADFERGCLAIAQKAEGDRSPNEQAMLKKYQDEKWQEQFDYNYDYEDDDEDDRKW
jgi:hypothetical protein